MNREQQEMALWRDAYMLAMSQDPSPAESSGWADAAVAEFCKRYPVEPVAPAPVWYDEPPCPKDGRHHACWVAGESQVQSVYWSLPGEWLYCQPYVKGPYPLAGRRVCPIAKPQEPTT